MGGQQSEEGGGRKARGSTREQFYDTFRVWQVLLDLEIECRPDRGRSPIE